MGKLVNWQFGDNLEFKHPICSDCKGNTFHVQISENDDVILHCVKCLNVIDFNLKFTADYEALEAKLAALVEEAENVCEYQERMGYDAFDLGASYLKLLKAAIAAAKGTP